MKRITVLACCLFSIGAFAEDQKIDKKVTVITAQSSADGKTTIHKELLEECIESLPAISSLEADVSSTSKFVHEINGDASKNDFVKMHSASIEINYSMYQKVLFLLSVNSVDSQKPTKEIVEKRIKESIVFNSNSSDGDSYANKSRREYYFSTAELAVENVKKQAKAWLKQQSAVVCTK